MHNWLIIGLFRNGNDTSDGTVVAKNDMEKVWTRSWPILIFCLSVLLEELNKSTKSLSGYPA